MLGGRAVRGASSLLESGPIELPSGELSFDYVLQSAEIPSYCGNSYDDTFLAIVSGPLGVQRALVDSVNTICTSSAGTYPEVLVQGVEAPPAMRGSARKSFAMPANVGSPAVVAFVVTDVGDQSFDTFVGIDSVSLGNGP